MQISDKLDEVIDFANDYDSYYKEFTEPQKIQYANELVALYYKQPINPCKSTK